MAQTQLTRQAEPPLANGLPILEYYEAADLYPVEVVNGEIVRMAAHQRKHSRVSRTVFLSLHSFAAERNLGEVWEETPYVLEGDKSRQWVTRVRQPDVSFIARVRVEAHNAEHGPDEGPWWLAPDLAVEIISPTDRYKDVEEKIAEYLRSGVRLVWLFNPHRRTVHVYTPENPGGLLLDEHATLSGDPVLPGWAMAVRDIFGG